MSLKIVKTLGLYVTAIVCFTQLSCSTVELSGQTVKESRNLSAFSEVVLTMSANVYLTQGNQQSVEVEADKAVLDDIITEISGNSVVIRTKEGHWHNLGNVKVYITMPTIEKLEISGSGDIISQSAVNASSIDLSVSGSGSIKIPNLTSPVVNATITGSGSITIDGNTGEGSLNTTITGSGSFNGDGFSTANVYVDITGSGTARVNAVKKLETNITGSGDVDYKGNPIVNASSTGSGKTRSAE